MKMTSDEIGALLGMKNPLWLLVKKQGVAVHNEVTDIFWSIPLDYPEVSHKLVTMHPTLDDEALHDKLMEVGESTEQILSEVDAWQRENILKALSENTPEKFWMIFPTVLGAYISSGMLAIKVKPVLEWAEKLMEDFSGLKYPEKAGMCAALMPSMPDQLVTIVSHLTNIAASTLTETEQWIEESLTKANKGNSLSSEGAAQFIKSILSEVENREIKLVSMAVFVWRRATYRVIDRMSIGERDLHSSAIMQMLSRLAEAGRSAAESALSTHGAESSAVN